jgi:hypothetical protein
LNIHPREELLYLPPDDVDVVENVELHHLCQPVKGEIGIDKPDQDVSIEGMKHPASSLS